MVVAIRCQHGAYFSQALELLAHRKVESVKSVVSSEFLLRTLPTEPILNVQLASLVGKGAGRRGEISGDLSRPQDDRPRKRVKWCAARHLVTPAKDQETGQ
eukprot:scaffold97161_cov69-Phaeocystis_antarctica.AAC.1